MNNSSKWNDIKISVVIPVYNAGYFLRPCLESIRNQTLNEIEVICVDDGSWDNSVKILTEYQKMDERFLVFQKKHTEGSGGGAARNLGIEKARGKYLAILDDDDFFELDMLEAMYNRAEQAFAQVTICNSYEWHYDNQTGKEVIVKNTLISPEKEVFSGLDVADSLFQITGGAAWHGLFQRDFIMEKEIRFRARDAFSADDLPFIFEAMALADRITVLNKSFLHHRVNTGNNQSRKAYVMPIYYAFVKLKEVLDRERLFGAYQCTFVNAAVHRLVNALNGQGYEHFKEYYNMLQGEMSDNLQLYFYLDLPQEKIYYKEAWHEYKKITELSPDSYFAIKKKQAMRVMGYILPEEINDSKVNIILYGAGVYGRYIYNKILQYNICCIWKWVDRDYERIGSPVQNPCLIKGNEYDYVLIAMINKEIVQEVRRTLMDRGIEERAILTLERNYEKESIIE